MLKTIIQKKFSPNSGDKYHYILINLRQNEFYDILDYTEAIETILIRWAAASHSSTIDINVKRSSIFFQGLSPETLDFMYLHGVTDPKNILDRINYTEQRVKYRLNKEKNIQEKKENYYNNRNFRSEYSNNQFDKNKYTNYKKNNLNPNNNFNIKNRNKNFRYNNNNSYKEPELLNTNDKTFGRPYCNIHTFYGHNTENCFKNKQNKDNDFKSNKRLSPIMEQITSPKTIEIPLTINHNKCLGLIDTGASRIFIDENFIKENNIKSENISPIKMTLANGEFVFIHKQVTSNFTIFENHNVKLKSKFCLIEKCEPKIILCTEFLLENEVIINYKELSLSINGIFFQIDNMKDSLDKEIINKTRICKIEEKCYEIIKEYKL